MERGDVIALLDHVLDLVGDEHALAELLGTVHHAVAYGVDFVIAADAAFYGVGEEVEDSLY